ncbi:MAG: hypothetical protein H6562_23180 [Lewinellaceae bacterium]|nr:hypothetical protein [Lewinellaceae bacterium]
MLCGHSIPANVATAHLLMPEPSLAVFDVHSTRILPDFPHNERSKNERPPLLHFAFFLLHFAFRTLPLFLSLSFGAQKKVTKEKAPATHLCLKLPCIPLHRINSPSVFCSCLFFVIAWLPGFALISQVRLKQYSVRPLHSGQFLNGPSADAGTLAGSVRFPFNQDIPGFSTQRTFQK